MWTWYPCGAACCAGQLVEMQSDLTGSSWSVSAQYLRGLTTIRRNGEYHHFDPLGNAGVITNSSGGVLSSNLYDAFDAPRYAQGSAQTPQRPSGLLTSDEGLLRDQSGSNGYIAGRSTQTLKPAALPLPGPVLALCAAACFVGGVIIGIEWNNCSNTTCKGQQGTAGTLCKYNCVVKAVTSNLGEGVFVGGCIGCLCDVLTSNLLGCIKLVLKLKGTVAD